MPTTARVNIAALDDSNLVKETLDRVWNTSAARHVSIKLVKEVQQTLAFPANCNYVYGETIASIVGGTLVVASAAPNPGWIVPLTPLIRAPFLLPKPDTGNLVIMAHLNDLDPVDLYFF